MRVILRILIILSLLAAATVMSARLSAQNKSRSRGRRAPESLISPSGSQEKSRYELALQEALTHPFDEARLQAYFKTLPKDGERYIVEGDLLLTEQDLRADVEGKSRAPRSIIPGPELAINLHEGDEDYYKDVAKRTLTF